MNKSIWVNYSNIKEYPPLGGEQKCDVLIVGGGITGILAAYFLKAAGIDCLVAEGARIGMGITARTTAQTSAQHELIYSYLTKLRGKDMARQYLDANLWAVENYRNLAKSYNFDFEDKDSYVYSVTDPKGIENELKALQDIGYNAQSASDLQLPLDIKAAFKFNRQGQFNPLMLISALSEGLNIVENTFVRKIEKGVAYTDNGVIRAKKIIISTHFPIINSSGYYFVKMYQQRSYVLALENAPDYNAIFGSEKNDGMYFRNYKNYLLVGGADHRTGSKGGGFAQIESFVQANYPQSKVAFRWATQDCYSHDQTPYIGRYSKLLPDVFVATGYNGWGMTGAMIAAKTLCAKITDTPSQYGEVFDSLRNTISLKLFTNAAQSAINFAKPTLNRCSHLGCGLKWNEQEQSWDCACHGSSFTPDRKVINNPAMSDTKIF